MVIPAHAGTAQEVPMSLKVIHIFFILAALSLASYMGVWCLEHHEPAVWAAVSFAASAALGVYLVWFIRKSKDLR